MAVGHRWRGAALADGSSALWVSLASVGRAVLLWLGGAVVAGAVLGWLGARIGSVSRYSSAAAAGLAAGLLGGQAAALAVRLGGWPAWGQFGWSLFISACITLVMATATPAAMLRRTNGVTSWLTYLAVTVPATGLAAAAWMQTSELTAYV